MNTATYTIYVASLSDYNAGRLVGDWIDCDGKDASELQEEIDNILAKSQEDIAEEWAIHDHEGFGQLISEYSSADTVAEIVEVLEGIDEPQALIEYADHVGEDDIREAAQAFEDRYHGQWDSERAYAEEYVDSTGMLDEIPENLRHYFDYEAFTRDLFMDGYFMTGSGYVFSDS